MRYAHSHAINDYNINKCSTIVYSNVINCRPIINALDGYIAVRIEKYDALWLGLDGGWLSAISFIA